MATEPQTAPKPAVPPGGRWQRTFDHDQIVADWHRTDELKSITDRIIEVAHNIGCSAILVRRVITKRGLVGGTGVTRSNKGKREALQAAAKEATKHPAMQQLLPALASLDPVEGRRAALTLAAGLTLSAMIDDQRAKVAEASAAENLLIQELRRVTEGMAGDEANSPPKPALVLVKVTAYSRLIDAMAKRIALEREVWGISKEAGATSWSEMLDQLDKSTVVNGQLVTPGRPVVAPDPGPIACESRRLDPSESGQPE